MGLAGHSEGRLVGLAGHPEESIVGLAGDEWKRYYMGWDMN